MGRKKNKSMTQEEEKKFIREVQKYKKNGLPVSWSQIDQKLFHRRYGSNFLYQHYNRTLTVKPFQWTRECRIELLYYCDKYKSDDMISWSSMIEHEGYSVSVTQLYNQYKSILRGNDSTLQDYENMDEEEILKIVEKAKAYRQEALKNLESKSVASTNTSTTTTASTSTANTTTTTRLPVKKRSRSNSFDEGKTTDEEEYVPPKRRRTRRSGSESSQSSASDFEEEDEDDLSDDYTEKRTKEFDLDMPRRMTRSAKRALDQILTEDEKQADEPSSAPTVEEGRDAHQVNNPLSYLIEACCKQREQGVSTSTAPPTIADVPPAPIPIIRKKAYVHHHQHSITQQQEEVANNNSSGIMNKLASAQPGFPPKQHLILPPIASLLHPQMSNQ